MDVFRNQIVTGLKTIWPKIKVINGRPRRPQSQGSVERCNGDVQNILDGWMRENLSAKWALALPIVASIKNRKDLVVIFIFTNCLDIYSNFYPLFNILIRYSTISI